MRVKLLVKVMAWHLSIFFCRWDAHRGDGL
jgi:hypothetical protein